MDYDLIIVGGGHAGCEAAWAGARLHTSAAKQGSSAMMNQATRAGPVIAAILARRAEAGPRAKGRGKKPVAAPSLAPA